MLLYELGRLGVDVRVDQLVQRLVDDLADLLDPPAPAQGGDVVADAGHLLLVRATEPEHELGVGSLHHVASRDQTIPVERAAEGERARLGDHRLVEIEERGATDHGPKVYLPAPTTF